MAIDDEEGLVVFPLILDFSLGPLVRKIEFSVIRLRGSPDLRHFLTSQTAMSGLQRKRSQTVGSSDSRIAPRATRVIRHCDQMAGRRKTWVNRRLWACLLTSVTTLSNRGNAPASSPPNDFRGNV